MATPQTYTPKPILYAECDAYNANRMSLMPQPAFVFYDHQDESRDSDENRGCPYCRL